MALVMIPPSLLKFANGRKSIPVISQSIRDAIVELDQQYPGFAAKLMSKDTIHRYASIFIDGTDIKLLKGLDSKLEEKSKVVILMALAGG